MTGLCECGNEPAGSLKAICKLFNCSFKAHGGIDDNCSVISSINGNDVNSPRTSIFCKAVDFLVNLLEGRKTFSNKISYCMVSSIPDESSMLAEPQDVSGDGVGVGEMAFGEMRPRIRPDIRLTVGENLGKTQPGNQPKRELNSRPSASATELC
ncbi:hypothetical protein ANN_05047 [Periplaneta americana]|uniref:Uncharacterized protein n=1 Tax=Periplaneta americana TaxID=6978 RepID=A0ABQ8TA59_PERAM|nr:hypothetical protein ANN_05047 [Periplaneta americana]